MPSLTRYGNIGDGKRNLRSAARASLVATIAVLVISIASSAFAATITVNNTTDPMTAPPHGFCTLREAINNANAGSDTSGGDCAPGIGTDTIVFSFSGTITLGSDLPQIKNNLMIDGSGNTITIDGASSFQVFALNSDTTTLTLNDLTIANGSRGVLANGGSLTVTNSTFSGNGIFNSTNGGAIYSFATNLIVVNSTFTNNQGGLGGAILFTCSVINVSSVISDSTFMGNASAGGGALHLENCPSTISNSTFLDNNGANGGGAIQNGAPTDITNSTFVGNVANFTGAAISVVDSALLKVNNSTFFDNVATFGGAAIDVSSATANLTNSIFASSSTANCAGSTIKNGGYNISDDASCGFGTNTGANGQTIGDRVQPLLDSSGLQNNGGPTETIALQMNSPAIDAIPFASCVDANGDQLTTDQRGEPRPDPLDGPNGPCDIGAYEFQDTFAGQPENANCVGKSVAALAQKYRGLDRAASALGYPSVMALQTAIKAFCGRQS